MEWNRNTICGGIIDSKIRYLFFMVTFVNGNQLSGKCDGEKCCMPYFLTRYDKVCDIQLSFPAFDSGQPAKLLMALE